MTEPTETETENEEGAEAAQHEESLREKMAGALNKSHTTLPEWVVLPSGGLRAPPNMDVVVMRVRPQWTRSPHKGERQLILWEMDEQDEQFAIKRAGGNNNKAVVEMTKQCIRYVDGVRADWGGTGGLQKEGVAGAGVDIHAFWRDLRHPMRAMLLNYYIRSHSFSAEDSADFFSNCLVSTRSAPI